MNEELHITSEGLDLIKSFEGLFLEAYKCPAGIWTIGYGHTGMEHNDGSVYEGRSITENEAIDLLAYDMEYFEDAVKRLIKVKVKSYEFDAITSFTFNLGEGNLKKSTLLKKLNSGDHVGASKEFIRWNKAGGKTLNGLTRRRASEERFFNGIRDYLVFSVEQMGELGYPVV